MDKQLGLELRFEDYIGRLCDIFDEVKRVLKKSGTCWVNFGDTYATSSKGSGGKGEMGDGVFSRLKKRAEFQPRKFSPLVPDKSLSLVPFRFAIEMVNRGWRLRNTIVWHKPNAMPSSVRDRFTVDFEYLFFFSKSRKYYFEQQFEPHRWADKDKRSRRNWTENLAKSGKMTKQRYSMKGVSYGKNGRNKRCVWTIPTRPFPQAHFAVYPEALCETPVKAGCPKGGIVLDPFMGAGTTAVVARKLERDYLGIELSEDYIKIAQKRLAQMSIRDES